MKRIIFVWALFVLLLPFGVPVAEAVPLTLIVEAGPDVASFVLPGNSFTVVDGVGNALDGSVSFNGLVGLWDFFTSYGDNALEPNTLSLDSTDVHNGGEAGVIRVTLENTYTNTTIGQAIASGLAIGNLVAAAGSGITVQSSVKNSLDVWTEVYAPTTFSGPTAPPGYPGFTFADAANVELGLADYTLKTVIFANFVACASCQNSVSMTLADVSVEAVQSVPEPASASLFLFGSGLLGLATAVRNRAKKRSA